MYIGCNMSHGYYIVSACFMNIIAAQFFMDIIAAQFFMDIIAA